MQVGARTPANLAMAALSLQALSGGRFLLGLGTSGPQVMEGWHGVRFPSPLSATRETVEIVRRVAAGEKLEHHGRVYDLPLPGGPGRADPVDAAAGARPHLHRRPRAEEPRPDRRDRRRLDRERLPSRARRTPSCPSSRKGPGRRRPDARPTSTCSSRWPSSSPTTSTRPPPATPGATPSPSAPWAARTRNFYNAAFARQGFGDDVAAVQDLWLAGRREEAAERVPREIGLKTNLLGTPAMVKDRLRLYRRAGITTLQAKLDGDLQHKVDTLAQLIDLVETEARTRRTA